MRGWRDVWGDEIDYWHLDRDDTQYDSVYREAQGSGRAFTGPTRLAVMHVTHLRGENEYGETGFYYNDSLTFQIAFDIFIQAGFSLADIDTGEYLNDRTVYDQKVFRVTQVNIMGKIQHRPTLISFECTQLKPDELRDDEEFAQFANEPTQ